MNMHVEHERLQDDAARTSNWKRWGPYLSERQWGTVREDYSPDSQSWNYLPHEHARSRAYRWGEDGILGFTDRECRLCFALTMWNEKDPILKERLYGLTGPQGNHGEDVKECYYYLDATPTYSYAKGLYKYPQTEFPYHDLLKKNQERSKLETEYELADSGIFDESRYFDIFAEYAKAAPNDVLIRITVINRGPEKARLHLLPTFWYRNTWSWGCEHEGCWAKPRLWVRTGSHLLADHETLGRFHCQAGPGPDGKDPKWLFTENETNTERLFGTNCPGTYRKDAFHDLLIHGKTDAVSPRPVGTKAAPHYLLELEPGESTRVSLRFCAEIHGLPVIDGPECDAIFDQRIAEADGFFEERAQSLTAEEKRVLRQAEAGLLWSKQFYHYIVDDWLEGDPEQPPVPESRKSGRNHEWRHLFNRDLISMPDKWEYPWYAAWDLAFHMIPFAGIDPQFAKEQLLLFLREWYMHPNGQIPAYEFALGDVNPPVHAWACWRVYKISGPRHGRDRVFLARVFHKLLLNFTWWVNRKDIRGKNLFSGGFLGLDNIGVFDRSQPLPTGGHLEQADGTAWMAFYCVTMLAMALELADGDPAYEDVASKFFEHFVSIADAMNNLDGTGLWDELDGFYYDHLHVNGNNIPLRIRSMVGIIPLFAVDILESSLIERLPEFKKRMNWFLENRADLAQQISYLKPDSRNAHGEHRLLAIPSRDRLERMLKHVLDEDEFLSDYGIRSMSRVHADKPFSFWAGGVEHRVEYVPGESTSSLFGGNSNWRGPIWFPVNFLIIEALERYHHFYGDNLLVECPTGSGVMMNLKQVADELSARLRRLFLPGDQQARPCHGNDEKYANDPHWKDLVLFYEYFHGDNGHGLGASHQTGWTGLVAHLLTDVGKTPNATHSP